MDLLYTGLRRSQLVFNAALFWSDQYSYTIFFFSFYTLPTENIKTQNFFLFPKQEVTYNQSSRGKKLADK